MYISYIFVCTSDWHIETIYSSFCFLRNLVELSLEAPGEPVV